MRKEKDAKASKCINEFVAKDKCHRGLKCPFSHSISNEDRKNPELRRRVAETKNVAVGKSTVEPNLECRSVGNDDLKSILLTLMADVKTLKDKQGYP